ncbi:50S ribosomal protein L28 [Candidatus Uzinura diaspidicola str. ASNER]|uniref:Large ribosomal subunit protein bL28 n=1 Tax=Candidatus Uzinura diaspidicola str. ASNER TaxID=1133592 RepID=L7VG11_9FLAO|nr:50S ribosomal protein L28 [Candidatus Uzinura diaspidicola str. ASNER]
MSRFCQITGKKSIVGYTVSHSNNRTKRRFDINLFNKRFYLSQEKKWIRLKVSAAGIKIINSIGIQKALAKRITIININNGKKSKNK